MKSFLKLFLPCVVGVFILGYNQVALAAFSPSSSYLPNSTCPEPPSRDFAVICGQVLSSVPMKVTITSTLEGAQEVWKPHAPVEGVSVYIYDCDNMSASCKRHGNLVNLFASTSTDEDGKFYLLMRKLDNFQEPSADLKIPRNVQSKKRYLVFNCGDRFAGMQVIPSYIDQTDLIQEVQCSKLINAYVKPKDTYVLAEKARYANEMGTDIVGAATDPNGIYPESYPSGYINHLTSQVAFKQTADYNLTAKNGLKPIWDTSPTVSTNFDLQVVGADPRFNKNSTEALWITLSNWLPGNEIECPAGIGSSSNCSDYVSNLELGSFWERDCFWKYRNQPAAIANYCMRKNPSDNPAGGVYVNETKASDRENRITNYYSALMGESQPTYIAANFVIQNKLPNIPPQEDVMFYKDLPARQDVTECVQDPTDIAKFLGLQFSNCVGAVNLRREGEVRRTEEKFMSCERLRMCGRALGTNDSSPSSWINFFTVDGPAQAMANPTSFVQKYDSITIDPGALNVYVCKMNPNDPNEIPVKISDIQPPWITDPLPGQYKLDSSYWSSELMYYFGKNNTTAKYGLDFYGNNDSYDQTLGITNTNYFRTSVEAGGVPQQGGTFCTYQSGGKKPNNTMAGALDIATNSATGQAINALANVLTSPVKEFDASYAYELRSGIPILSAGRDFNRLGEYSRVNALPEKIIIGSTANGMLDDLAVLSNVNFKGDPDHYPYADISLSFIPCILFPSWLIPTQTAIEYALTIGCTYDYTAPIDQQITCDGTKYSIEDFIASHNGLSYFLRGDSICQFANSYQDGKRTATSSIFVTSAADRRIKSMITSSIKPGDFFDSLLSIGIGNGILNYQLNLIQFITAVRSWIELFLGTNELNKSFMDRLNAPATLGTNPGKMDDIHAQFSSLSEATFITAFPLPLAPDEGGGVNTADWGTNECYPWHTVPFTNVCNTDNTEAKETHTGSDGICTGSEEYCRNLLSRTCRLDQCQGDGFLLPCTCTKTAYIKEGPIYTLNPEVVEWVIGYTYIGSCPSTDNYNYDNLDFVPNNSECDSYDRYYCAADQKTCIGSDGESERGCLKNPEHVVQVNMSLKRIHDLIAAEGTQALFECSGTSEQIVHTIIPPLPPVPPVLPPNVVEPRPVVVTTIPACILSKAGPYTCSGDLTKDSELKIKSTIIDPYERAVIPASTSADALLETNNELLKAWANPYQAEYSFRPYQSLTALTSVTNSTPDSLEIYRRKDTYGIGGAATLGARLRTMFGSPTRAATDPSPEYKDFNIHCTNPSLGSVGSWSCNIENPPDPEVINLQLLDPGTDSSCNFNPSDACALLILGRAPDGSINQFSESFVKVMDNIGGAFNLPPSVIMSYMSALKMTTYAYYFSNDPIAEKEFINVTAPWYGEFESCDNTNTASQGPYDWITYWFNNALLPGSNGYNLLNNIQLITGDVATGRGRTADKCNFLDGSYAVASSIASDRYVKAKSLLPCSNLQWPDVQRALTTLFVGAFPVGYYQDLAARTFSPTGTPAQIFTACRK